MSFFNLDKTEMIKIEEVFAQAYPTMCDVYPDVRFYAGELFKKLYKYFDDDDVITTLGKLNDSTFARILSTIRNLISIPGIATNCSFRVTDESLFFHGTSLAACKKILEDGIIKRSTDHSLIEKWDLRDGIDNLFRRFSAGQVFVTDDFELAALYGFYDAAIKNIDETLSLQAVVLALDLDGLDCRIFTDRIDREIIVNEDIPADRIKHIYEITPDLIIKEVAIS